MAGFKLQGTGWLTETPAGGGPADASELVAAGPLSATDVQGALDALAANAWQFTSGNWTWNATPKTVMTFTLAEREAISLHVIVHLTTYRVATTSFTSTIIRALCNARRPAGGSAAASIAATLNAGTVTTPTIAATASGNDLQINIGTGLATNENQVVYYDCWYQIARRTISY